MAYQPNYDNFRNIRQALVIHNSLNLFPAIKLILGGSPKLDKGKTCIFVDKTLVQRAIELAKDLSVFNLKIFLLLGKNMIEY